MAHPNQDLAMQAYKAFAARDMATLDRLMADDVRWHVAGTSAVSGDYDGKQQVFELFGALSERSGGTFSLDIHDILANDDHAVALVKTVAEGDGQRLEDDAVHVMHVKDGRVVSFYSYQWDQEAAAAFWG